MAEKSLFEKYGGFSKVSKIVLSVYDTLLDSEEIGPFFDNIDMSRMVDHQTKFIASLLGGPASYSDNQLRQLHSHLDINDMHFELGLLKLDVRRDMHLSFLCYKNATDSEMSMNSFFVPVASVRTRVTRNSATKAVKVPNFTSPIARKSFSFRGPQRWNHLGGDFRMAGTVAIFRRLVSCDLRIAIRH